VEEQLRATTASPCSVLDIDDVQSLPGWPKLQQYAVDTWGAGDVVITVNPPNYRDKTATICVVSPSRIVLSGGENCSIKRVVIAPKRKSRVIEVKFGYKNIGKWNITSTSSAARAKVFRQRFQIPAIKQEHLHRISDSAEFVNAPNNGFTTVASNMTTKRTNLPSIEDQFCIGTILSRECLIPAHGRIQLVATGYIWFTYSTPRAPLAKPNGGKHRRYAIKLQDVLKNATERSTWIDYTGTMNSTMRTDYFSQCRPKTVI